MGKFPTRDGDLIILCQQMIMGYIGDPATFMHANAPLLQGDLADFNAKIVGKEAALAAYKSACGALDTSRVKLRKDMMLQGKQSMVDTSNNAVKLAEIGWSPPSPPTPVAPPGEPLEFKAVVQGPETVYFTWREPARGSGGKVRDYRIDRRQSTGGTMYGDWQEIVVTQEKEIIVRDQPRGVQLQYRVVAMNKGGENASKAEDVVL